MMTIFRAQKILASIGYPVSVDGTQSRSTSSCLADFQKKNGLQPSGALDEATSVKLEEVESTAVPYFGPPVDATGAEDKASGSNNLWYFLGGAAIFGSVGYFLGRKMATGAMSEIFTPADDEVFDLEADEEIKSFYKLFPDERYLPRAHVEEIMEEEDFE